MYTVTSNRNRKGQSFPDLTDACRFALSLKAQGHTKIRILDEMGMDAQ